MSGKKRPDEIVRERLEGARDKVVVKVGAKRLKRLINTAKYAVLLILLLVAVSLFFRVNVIDVSGEVTMFNEGDVIRAAHLSEGNLLFGRTVYPQQLLYFITAVMLAALVIFFLPRLQKKETVLNS